MRILLSLLRPPSMLERLSVHLQPQSPKHKRYFRVFLHFSYHNVTFNLKFLKDLMTILYNNKYEIVSQIYALLLILLQQ